MLLRDCAAICHARYWSHPIGDLRGSTGCDWLGRVVPTSICFRAEVAIASIEWVPKNNFLDTLLFLAGRGELKQLSVIVGVGLKDCLESNTKKR